MKSKRAPRDTGVNTDPATNFLPRAPAIFATMYSRQRGVEIQDRGAIPVDKPEPLLPFHLPLRSAQLETESCNNRVDKRALEVGRGRGLHRFRFSEHPGMQGIREVATIGMGGFGYRPRRPHCLAADW